MRPVRIEVEGFSAYRTREVVDLGALQGSDLPFFSLSGATGAGKSSLVDAMIFALYGRIPRLGGTAVAPVISAGTDRARVRLDFEVDGVVHTAVRLAQRSASGGATVKEARLECGDQVLADGADRVTAAVEELLRLGFDDFTRTVVLPQGDFARFLNATKAERQALLRGILGLEVYGTVRDLATARQAVAADRAAGARTRLEAIEVPDEHHAELARERLGVLEAMAQAITEQEKSLAVLAAAVAAADAELERLEGARGRLEALAPPEDIEDLAAMAARAAEEMSAAEEAHAVAVAEVRRLEEGMEELPDPETLAVWSHNYQSLHQVISRIGALDGDGPKRLLADAETRLAGAIDALEGLRSRREALRLTHAAHALGAALAVGEPCPVCRHPVETLPLTESLPELDHLDGEIEAAQERLVSAQGEAGRARSDLTEHDTTLANLETIRAELAESLDGAPDQEELRRIEGVAERLKEQHRGARLGLGDLEGLVVRHRKALEELASRQHSMGRLLTTAQLQVADLGPPVSESDDVMVQWKDLLAWRAETLASLNQGHAVAVRAATEAAAAHRKARASIIAEIETAGLALEEPFSTTLAAETERARHTMAMIEKAKTETAALQAVIEVETGRAEVAATLAGHLRANGFEQWMMAGALETLVHGANGLLAQLSEGGYSLHSDEGSFTIVDHRNADERRSVSTLSGGETFLVSLALALSLAETLASAGGARLDAIILDEGFGTLDDESLDTVASVLEGLAGKGLMVGVITHVKELAGRAAARFEVTRGAAGSTVRELA